MRMIRVCICFLIGSLLFPGGSFAVTRTVASVKDFGAVGDAVNDDTLAFQAAFDANADIFIPAGVYRITSTLTLPAPFKVQGAGSETTVLQFEDMGGYNIYSGIEVDPSGTYQSGSSMSDLTIAIKGANGKAAIQTPRGSAVFDANSPTYVFERMKFRGDKESSSFSGLYDYGWLRYFDVGDGQSHTFRDILIFGNYDFTQNPASIDSDSATAFYFSSEQGYGGVHMPIVDHCFTHYTGVSVQFGYRVNNPLVMNCQFHRGYRGIYSPNGVNATNSNDYGVRGAQLRGLNINSQLEGVSFAKTADLDVNNVRVTRADGAYNHGSTWRGFRFDEGGNLKLVNTRAYNTATNYTGTHVGMWLTDCDFSYIAGYNARDNLSFGLILEDTHRTSVFGSTFTSPSVSAFYFKGSTTSDIVISGEAHDLNHQWYKYDADISKSQVLLRDMTVAN